MHSLSVISKETYTHNHVCVSAFKYVLLHLGKNILLIKSFYEYLKWHSAGLNFHDIQLNHFKHHTPESN